MSRSSPSTSAQRAWVEPNNSPAPSNRAAGKAMVFFMEVGSGLDLFDGFVGFANSFIGYSQEEKQNFQGGLGLFLQHDIKGFLCHDQQGGFLGHPGGGGPGPVVDQGHFPQELPLFQGGQDDLLAAGALFGDVHRALADDIKDFARHALHEQGGVFRVGFLEKKRGQVGQFGGGEV